MRTEVWTLFYSTFIVHCHHFVSTLTFDRGGIVIDTGSEFNLQGLSLDVNVTVRYQFHKTISI